MARVAKSKKNRDISVHSRAARRAASPSLDVDKSILDTKTEKESGGHASAYGGILKKKKQKPLSRQQRLRQEKGMERAEQNLDKLSKKVADSHFREKKVKTRNAAWDDLNEKIAVKPVTTNVRTQTDGDAGGEELEKDVAEVDDVVLDSLAVTAATPAEGDPEQVPVDEVL
ncbi:hypothetical protein KVT40_000796 [Elsinoe batatas]|uniref:Alb1-domain-containing protein n=1 Tax=Elsinoe batatas TaxID=2601811 RepID=A0A8K0LBY7_9PEZI|nr:hypothetical protein KVT40_000796 [Elsinoe batatas]